MRYSHPQVSLYIRAGVRTWVPLNDAFFYIGRSEYLQLRRPLFWNAAACSEESAALSAARCVRCVDSVKSVPPPKNRPLTFRGPCAVEDVVSKQQDRGQHVCPYLLTVQPSQLT